MHGINSRPTLLRLRVVCAATARLLLAFALPVIKMSLFCTRLSFTFVEASHKLYARSGRSWIIYGTEIWSMQLKYNIKLDFPPSSLILLNWVLRILIQLWKKFYTYWRFKCHLTDDILRCSLVVFCTNGASVMTGKTSGIGTGLKQNCCNCSAEMKKSVTYMVDVKLSNAGSIVQCQCECAAVCNWEDEIHSKEASFFTATSHSVSRLAKCFMCAGLYRHTLQLTPFGQTWLLFKVTWVAW